jgi:glycosyltransferase involved in cell wall biosynthesis
MKVVIISHSYLEQENQKNILALDLYCEIKCLLPRKGFVLMFRDYAFQDGGNKKNIFFTYETFFLTRSQFLFKTLTMNFHKTKPDIINVEYNPWSLIFIQTFICKTIFSRKSKIICTVKKNTYQCRPGFYGWVKKWLTIHSLRYCDHIIAASGMAKTLLEQTLSVPEYMISTCHHLGVDIKLFKPNLDKRSKIKNKVIIGYAGRFDAEKGVMDLLDAVKKVRKNVSEMVELKLLGCGAYSEYLDAQLTKESAENSWLAVLPPIPNSEVAEFLKGIDVFVLPSRVVDDHQEHDAHVLLEALSAGVVCVGTRSGIIPEILGDGSGFLVSPEAPSELAELLTVLISEPEERHAKEERARRKAEREFSLDMIARKKVAIFNEVLE